MTDYAFPQLVKNGDGDYVLGSQAGGLTKRELYAAMALQGMVSDPRVSFPVPKPYEVGVAELSVKCADALIAELAKGKSNE